MMMLRMQKDAIARDDAFKTCLSFYLGFCLGFCLGFYLGY